MPITNTLQKGGAYLWGGGMVWLSVGVYFPDYGGGLLSRLYSNFLILVTARQYKIFLTEVYQIRKPYLNSTFKLERTIPPLLVYLLPFAISVFAIFFSPPLFSTRIASNHNSGQCGFFSLAFSRMDRALMRLLCRSSRWDNNSQSGVAFGHFFSWNEKWILRWFQAL